MRIGSRLSERAVISLTSDRSEVASPVSLLGCVPRGGAVHGTLATLLHDFSPARLKSVDCRWRPTSQDREAELFLFFDFVS